MKVKPCIYSFSTFKDNKSRTVGLGCLLKDSDQKLTNWNEQQALTLNKLFGYNENQYLPTAKGKVFFITIDREDNVINNKCFQVKDNIVKEVFCGNSTAAASAIICRMLHKKSEIKFKYYCQNICVNVVFTAFSKDSLINISQSWSMKLSHNSLKNTNFEDNEVIRFDLFNDYIFLKGPVDNLENLIKRELMVKNIDKKLAIIYPGEVLPQVHFYNCNGLHGAAPQTGLAALSILADKVSWIKDIFPERKLSTPSSIEFLPEVIQEQDGNIKLIMPNVDVRLSKIF